jgi:threonine synthase
MICVQASATAPLVQAFEQGLEDSQLAAPGHTLAFGLNVPGGVGHFRVLEIIRESGGAAVAVAEADIHRALAETWRWRHDWVGPEGAACLAALPRLLDEDLIRTGDEVVVFNTGSLEKYLPELRHLLRE